jgi:hypothetical protein
MSVSWGDVPAWLSLAATALLLWRSYRKDQEVKKTGLVADVRPELRDNGTHDYRLYLMNHGSATATNVRVKINGVPIERCDAAVIGDVLPSLIGPNGGQVSCIMNITHAHAPPFSIEVRWDDDSGKEGCYRGTLSF